ncbi:MAG: TOBE domain-containing protein, partial [Ferruginibacter sp.]
DGSPHDLFFNHLDQYVAGLLGDYTFIENPAELFSLTKQPRPVLMLRPSQVRIIDEQQSTLVGRLESVHFMGDYYLFTVRIQDMLIKGMHPSGLPLPAIGTNVHIGIQHPAYSSYV